MRLVPLEPDPRFGRLARLIAVLAVILPAAVAVPLIRLQLGDPGWEILREAVGDAFWPLAGLAAVGAALLLAYALWLRRRPALAPLLWVVPAALVVTGAILGIRALPADRLGGPAALAATAAALSTPAWALSLAAVLAAAGSVVLGALTLRRARVLGTPWGPALATVVVLVLINAYTQYARLPVRPFTVTVIGGALLGALLTASPWATDAPPDADHRQAAVVPLALMLGLAAVLAAVAAEAVVFRAAALYAQGPGPEAHAQSLAFGGARSTTARFLSGALPLLGTIAVITLACSRLREELRPRGRAATLGLATAFLLLALSLGAFGVHRYALGQAIHHANHTAGPAPATLESPSKSPSKSPSPRVKAPPAPGQMAPILRRPKGMQSH